eukprot:TRINITY_DN9806_c0_g1_i1.p1 TRINITY_DN9806_c0_g1~~TRINITY_DN9806_c0_g1_i1.p1  ORF type:complete len:195 (+),score=58.38 TRINITY_DN9806_c0_g1_i1:269-853(+)
MGAASVKGLKMMETIFPSEDGRSVFADPKLKAKLDKEIAKGKIKPEMPADEEPVDGDMDELIDRVIKEVWATYDVKNQGFIDKKKAAQFFKDALEVYALRKGMKGSKDALGPGVNQSKASDECVAKLNKSGSGRITFEEFEDYMNTYDIEEALGPFLARTSIDVKAQVPMVDISQISTQAEQVTRPKYREYPDD